MKKWSLLIVLVLLLTGCGSSNDALDRGMALRGKLIAGNGCSFDAVITADYGDKSYSFCAQCTADHQGNLTFQVTQPELIQGVSGTISAEGGKLTYDAMALAFGLLADDQVSPVSAPWLMVKALQGGYVRSCGKEGDEIRMSIDDSFDDDALQVDVWLGQGNLPVRADILYRDRRILSLQVSNYKIL